MEGYNMEIIERLPQTHDKETTKASLITSSLMILNIVASVIFILLMSSNASVEQVNVMKLVLSISMLIAYLQHITMNNEALELPNDKQAKKVIKSLLLDALLFASIMITYVLGKDYLLNNMDILTYKTLGHTLIFSFFNFLLFAPSITKFYIIKAVAYKDEKHLD